MTLTQIRYAVETARAGSISLAAKNLFVSQSVISNAIKSLESDVGIEIFVRHRTGVSLTPFGETFISYLSTIDEQITRIDRMFSEGRFESYGSTLVVSAMNYPVVARALIDVLKKMRRRGIRIECYDDEEEGVLDLVASGTAEVGVLRVWSCYREATARQMRSRGVDYHPIVEFDIGIVVGPHSPLFDRESITAAELADLPMVVYRGMDAGPHSDIFRRLKMPIARNKIVTSSRAAIAEVIGETDAYMLSTMMISSRETTGLENFERRTLRLEGTDVRSEIAWISRDGWELSEAAREFVNFVVRSLRA